jgi:TPR repeat protein
MIWYQKAAAQGVGDAQSNAQNNIGALYEYGRGVPVDVKKAVEWYKKAAANNNDKAKSNLARLGSASLVRPGSGFSFISAFFVFVVVWVLRRMFYPGINTTEIFLENVIEIAPGVQGGDIRISVYGKSTYVTQGQKSNFPQMSKKLFDMF